MKRKEHVKRSPKLPDTAVASSNNHRMATEVIRGLLSFGKWESGVLSSRQQNLGVIVYVVLVLQACKTPVKLKVSRSDKFDLRFQVQINLI